MNFKKKALLPAIAMVLVSVIALTGVSYAWFTMSNTADVTGLDLTVKSASGVQISADCSSFSSLVTYSKIEAAGTKYTNNINVLPEEVLPVSSSGKLAVSQNGTYTLQLYSGSVEADASGNNVLKTAALDDAAVKAAAVEERNYIAFDLFFQMSADRGINLGKDTAITLTNTDRATNSALRVAFVNLGNATTAADAKNLTGSASSNLMIWEPYATVHTDAVKDMINNGEVTATNNYVDTYGVNYAGDITDYTSTASANLAKLNANIVSDGAIAADTDLFDLKAGYNKVRVYIWIEGQDLDCDNSISGNTVSVNLQFTQDEEVNG